MKAWIEGEACRSRAHCYFCQVAGHPADATIESDVENSLRWRHGMGYDYIELPAPGTCPLGVDWRDVLAQKQARAERALVNARQAAAEYVAAHVGAMPARLSDTDRVETLAKLVDTGVCSLEVAEAAAALLGINLDAEVEAVTK